MKSLIKRNRHRLTFVALTCIALLVAGCSLFGPEPYTISGTVVNQDGFGVEGVTLALSGKTSGSTKTNAEGKWQASVRGNVTVTPSKSDFTFDPVSVDVTEARNDVNFTAIADDKLTNWALGAAYTYNIDANASYPDPNMDKLTDGKYAEIDYEHEGWVGHRREEFRYITVDLGETRPIQKITANFLQQWPKGVRYPNEVRVEISNDGITWTEIGSEEMVDQEMDLENAFIRKAEFTLDDEARYVRFYVLVINWVFIDEIEVLGQ